MGLRYEYTMTARLPKREQVLPSFLVGFFMQNFLEEQGIDHSDRY